MTSLNSLRRALDIYDALVGEGDSPYKAPLNETDMIVEILVAIETFQFYNLNSEAKRLLASLIDNLGKT